MWHSSDQEKCRGCGKAAKEYQDAEDFDEDLDQPEKYYVDPQKPYWHGYSQGDSGPSQHSQDAASLGVKGRFKEKKNS
jgi:hypothetical protein